MYVFIFLVKVTEWLPIGIIAAHSAYGMFSWYKYLIVSLVFSHLGFWSGNLFLIAHFPGLCLLVPCYDGPDLKLFILVGWGRSFLSSGSNWCFSFAPELVSYSAPRDLHRRAAY